MKFGLVLEKNQRLTNFVIYCTGLFLCLYFLNRDIARIGVYLIAIVGLYYLYKNGFRRSQKYFWFISAVIFVFFILIADFLSKTCCAGQEYYIKPFIHLAVIFLFVLLNKFLEGWMRWLLNVSIVYVLVCVFSYALSDNPLHSAKYFESHYALYLLVAPIAYMVSKSRVETKTILNLFSLGGLVIGLCAFVDASGFARTKFWFFDEYPVVPNFNTVGIGLGMNSIHFAIVAAAWLAILFASISMLFWKLNKLEIIVSLLSVLLLFFALALSGGRSGWISLPFIFIVPLVFSTWPIKVKAFVFALIIVGLVVVSQTSYVQKRLLLVTQQVSEYMNSTDINDSIRITTSVGLRFELWKAAWDVFVNNPILGAGPGNFRHEMQKLNLEASGRYHHSIQKHKNPHSLYFKALAERGLLGISSTLLILVLPGLLFLIQMFKSQIADQKALAISGFLVVTVFTLGGITIGSLHKTELSIFYIFFIGLLFGLTYANLKSNLKVINKL